jgi:hypothetical protein
MQKLILAIVFLLISGIGDAIPIQDSILIGNLEFSNNQEKEILVKKEKLSIDDIFDLYFAANAVISAQQIAAFKLRVNKVIEAYKEPSIQKQKVDKRLKFLFKQVQSEFLKKYQLNNKFDDLCTSGEFNCVTASALYAYILSKSDIPYFITEIPSHVYIILYPEKERIVLETTDASSGYMVYDSKFKKEYVNNLKIAKLISQEEFDNATIEGLFDQHFFAKENIDFQKLTGLYYHNLGIYALEEDNNKAAFNFFLKAYHLYPSTRILMGIANSADKLILHSDYKLPEIEVFKQLYYLKSLNLQSSSFLEFYQNMFDKNFKTMPHQQYDSLHQAFVNVFGKETWINEIQVYYYGQLAFSENSIGKKKSALEYAITCYSYSTKEAIEQAKLMDFFTETLSRENNEATEQIYALSGKFPELDTFYSMMRLQMIAQLQLSLDNFNSNKIIAADDCLAKFESIAKLKKESSMPQSEIIAVPYIKMARYWYGKGNTPKAKSFIQRGLLADPHNSGLIEMQRYLK